jgi:hypothetical protein
MVAVNLRFEDLRARDNQKIDREFFNRRYRLIAEAISAIADEVNGVSEDSDNLVSLGLIRVNEVLGPLLAKVQAASENGFLVAESQTTVQLSVGLQTTLEVTAGWARDLFQPTPYVMLTRAGGAVDDWALFNVADYNRDNGGLAGEVVAISGAIDAAAYDDWTLSATAGIAKAVMEQAAAAQVAIDDAQAAAVAAVEAAAAAQAVLANGPVSSVNGQTGAVALGMSDIANLVSTLGAKADGNHGHSIEQISGLADVLSAVSKTVVEKSAAYTAKSGDVIFVDTSGGAFEIALPLSAETGDTIVFVDAPGSWATEPLTIDRNGHSIGGLAEDMICALGGVTFSLRYSGTTWTVAAGAI